MCEWCRRGDFTECPKQQVNGEFSLLCAELNADDDCDSSQVFTAMEEWPSSSSASRTP